MLECHFVGPHQGAHEQRILLCRPHNGTHPV